MTTNTDVAREAAWTVFADMVTTPGKLMAEVFNTTIDAFLAKSLEGADERVAEIAARIKRAELHENESICFKTNEASELLTLVTALSAKLKEQKAAHAKMMRDRAAEWDTWGTSRIDHKTIATEYRRLADKIEGGE